MPTPSDFITPLLDRIHTLVKTRRTTWQVLAAVAGLSRASLYDIIVFRRAQPKLGTLLILAEVAGIELELVLRPMPGISLAEWMEQQRRESRKRIAYSTGVITDADLFVAWNVSGRDLHRCAQELLATRQTICRRLGLLGLLDPTSRHSKRQLERDRIVADGLARREDPAAIAAALKTTVREIRRIALGLRLAEDLAPHPIQAPANAG